MLTIPVLVWFTYGLYQSRAEFLLWFESIQTSDLLAFVLLTYVQWFIRAFRDLQLYKASAPKLKVVDLFFINNSQGLFNNLPLKAGTILTATTLKTKFKVSIKEFSKVFLFQNILILCSSVIIVFLEWLSIGIIHQMIALVLLVCVFLLLSRFIVISVQSSKLLYLVLLTICTLYISGMRMYYLAAGDLEFGSSLALAAAMTLGQQIAFTPAGLGVKELFTGFTSDILKLSLALGLTLATLDRILVLLLMIINFIFLKLYTKSRGSHGYRS